MANVYSDIYWTDEFDITIADLDRIAAHIRETAQAHDLTTLARRVVRGRLRFGPETSAPARPAWAEDPSVRLWNPAAEWKEGDQVIVAVGFPKSRRRTLHKPFVGEVIGVKRGNVEVRIDTLGESRTYSTLAKDEYELSKWAAICRGLGGSQTRYQRCRDPG